MKDPVQLQRTRWSWFAVVMLAALLLTTMPPVRRAEQSWLDAQWRVLRELAAPATPAAAADPVVVGIDEATYDGIAEPFALWHRPLGALFSALAEAAPRAVLVDIALPERSFDAVVAGSDAALLTGVRALARTAPVTFAVMVGPDGQHRPVLPALVAVAGAQSFAPALLPLDEDSHVRRLAYAADGGAPAPTLAGSLATRLGAPAAPPGALIDFTLGRPFDYLPMHEVLAAVRDGDTATLRQRLGGRPVVVGSVLAHVDRIATPVPLAAWEPADAVPPGTLVHAQALRSLLAGRAVSPLPWWLGPLLAVSCAAVFWVPWGPWRTVAVAAGGVVAIATLSMALLSAGSYLPTFAAASSVVIGVASRQALDAALALRERARLRGAFGGYVSPQVLERLLAGRIDPSRPDGPRPMAFLFADLRGFTTRGQHESALDTVVMLNRYYDAIIEPIHAQGGMVDNFRGDGIMVVFGAPEPLSDPARAAVLAAGGMVRALAGLNRRLHAEGRPALEMGIGIACGEAVAGEVGSRYRHDYTAIGDAVNVAARLQDQCKPHRAQAVVSAAVAERVQPGDAEIHELGAIDLRGHTAVHCCALAWTVDALEEEGQ